MPAVPVPPVRRTMLGAVVGVLVLAVAAVVWAPVAGADPAATAPTFTSPAAADIAKGAPVTLTVTTTGNPTPRVTLLDPLPDGLSFHDDGDGTATVSGTPAPDSGGYTTARLEAANDAGTAEQDATLHITENIPEIAFTTTPPDGAVVGGNYAVGVQGGGATTPVVLSTENPDVCALSGTTVRLVGGGTCIVDATQAADATYAAGSAAQAFTVRAAPVVAPRVTTALSSPRRPQAGWYRTPVTVTFHCVAGSAPVTCPPPVTLSRSAARQQVTRRVVAQDGGTVTVTAGPIDIDRVAPTVTVVGVSAGAHDDAAPRTSCSGHDALSGVARCTLTTTRHGRMVTVVAEAVDRAGNETTAVVRYPIGE